MLIPLPLPSWKIGADRGGSALSPPRRGVGSGYTIGYYGRPFEARNKTKGGAFEGDDRDSLRFRLGSGQVRSLPPPCPSAPLSLRPTPEPARPRIRERGAAYSVLLPPPPPKRPPR